MTYNPMRITHINDVLPHIEGRKDFVVARKDGYTVIDYVFAGPDTFDHPARIECRGLKFDPDGAILARPFHKFFNIGEKPETQTGVLDFDAPHVIMDKLDGSMIHPAIVDGEVVFMTRMGRTDVARKAERHLTFDLARECRGMLEADITPIFEWTAPDNRIVVRYEGSRLTLLAARHNHTGEYLPLGGLVDVAMFMGVDLVDTNDSAHTSGPEFLAYARAITGKEGFVIRFANGLMVKAKGEDYVLKHRAKESILQEKNVLALILREQLDDVLPLLEDSDRASVERYRDDVLAGVEATARTISAFVDCHRDLPQKDFAIGPAAALPPLYRPLAFTVRGIGDARSVIVASILKQCGSASGVDSVRALFGASFSLAANDNETASEARAA
jgi:RNA ligase